ncbi:MAG: 23S rRNA (guanosine(2251)-2'-O)-methyltransferase RlmB [Proteobacteria bacterium]|nr:23S rRNA (guanosine(2251)-2'-O)-methyltransferase RlmB [Pseudomonadota bacterium]
MAARDLVIGGLHAARMALERAGGDVLELWLRRDHDSEATRDIEARARSLGVSVQRLDQASLNRLYGDDHHQGVVLRRRPPATVELKTVLARAAAQGHAALLLVLDNVQDPRNFGACLRAADGAGVDAVIFTRDRAAGLTSVVAKTASGALDSVPLVAVANLASALRMLAEAGVWTLGAAQDGAIPIYQADLTLPSALVLGNEGEGLRRLTRERCDQLVTIPMHGQVSSLNVATAAAVCLFEARRQRALADGR